MSGVSKNSFDLINNSFEKLKGKYGKGFLATLITIAPLMLCAFSVVLIPVAILLWGVLQTGYIRYMRALINGENPSYKILFSEFSNPGVEILLGTILVCASVLGTVLFIVPAVIFVAFYSMSLFFAEAKRSASPIEAMKDTRKAMKGNYTNMLSYKVLFWLLYVFVLVFTFTGVIITFKLWAEYKALAVVTALLDFLFTTLIWSVITTYYHVANELYFKELLEYQNNSDNTEKAVEIIEEPVVEKTVEQKSEDKVVTKKAPAKKTATAKPAQKKTTQTAGKTSTTKTASKSTAKTTGTKTTKTTAAKTTKKTTK